MKFFKLVGYAHVNSFAWSRLRLRQTQDFLSNNTSQAKATALSNALARMFRAKSSRHCRFHGILNLRLELVVNLGEMGFVLIRHSGVEHRMVNMGSRAMDLVCVGETVGKMGEVDEMGERELVLVVSVRCGKEWDMTRG